MLPVALRYHNAESLSGFGCSARRAPYSRRLPVTVA